MNDRFMKFGRAMEIVLDEDPEQQLAIDTVEDWATNNLEEDD